MAVSAKMAAYLKKEMKAAKGKPEEKGVKREVRAMELQNKTEVELNKIRKSGGDRGKAADFELDRREANRRSKAIGGSKDPDFEAMTGPKLRELKKYYSGEKKFEELDSDVMGFDPSDYAKGGMAKKKVAAKKPAVKKPAVKKPIKRGK
jgi:hypothetical protein